MLNYILRRLALIPLTLLGIMAINFVFAQFAPGGPVEQTLAKIHGQMVEATSRISGGGGGELGSYRGAQGLDSTIVKEIEKQFGFDKPPLERFLTMLWNYIRFDFGKSYYRDQNVSDLILSKMPVSISLGVFSTLLIYMISIPLGIAKAVRDGSRFDTITSWVMVVSYAIPSFLFAIFLIVMFSGGRFLSWFPLRGLTSPDWVDMSLYRQVLDYLWHLVLPIAAMVIGGFAQLTMLTKNSFLEEINKQYVLTARAKGLTENKVLYGHIFRNAMLLVIAGFPSALVHMLFTGSVLIEVVFSLDGLGLLGFEAVLNRDYPVMFATLYFFSLIGLLLNLVSDLMYHLVDPRIDFSERGA